MAHLLFCSGYHLIGHWTGRPIIHQHLIVLCTLFLFLLLHLSVVEGATFIDGLCLGPALLRRLDGVVVVFELFVDLN